MESVVDRHIVHITDHAFIGGGARVLYSVARGMAALKWSSSVICGNDGPLAEDLVAIGIPAEALPISDRYQFLVFFPWLVWRLRRRKPAAVILYGPVAGCIGGIAARLARIPCIVYSADFPLYHSAHGFPGAIRSTVVERIACAYASAVWCKSRTDMELYQAHNAVRLDKAHLIPNCVAADIMQRLSDMYGPRDGAVDDSCAPIDLLALRKRWGLSSEDMVLGYVGRLTPQKGADVLMMAFPAIAQSVPAARLLIVGDGPDRTRLERLACELGITERVVFTGAQRDVVPYYLLSDAIVVPSRYEAFGNVAIEAMACGRPVVASRVGGLADSIVDEVCGKLVAPDNSGDLAAAVVWLLQSPERARDLGKQGRQRALTFYSEERLASSLDWLIRANLSRRFAAHPMPS